MEYIIALAIFITAAYILFKNIKKKSSGGCDCGSCSKSGHCPNKR